MTAERLLNHLLGRGIQIWKTDREIRLRGPKGALTTALRQDLSRHKAALLDFLATGRKLAPLSFAQQRLWFLHRLNPEGTAYNVTEAWRLRGRLRTTALGKSLARIVRRHESLRTFFRTVDGRGVQVIDLDSAGRAPFEIPLVDLGGLPARVRCSTALARAADLASRPLLLDTPPLFSTVLFRLGHADHLLFMKLHHILSDGWSLGVLRRELAAFYEETVTHRPARLPELPLQYADFAVRQRGELRGETLESHLTYWREQLADLPAVRIPTDRPRPAVARHRGAIFEWTLAERLTSLVHRHCRDHGASLYMGLLATMMALLQRYTGQTDLVVGTPIANRNRQDVEDLIGFFVNTLVMRADLKGRPTGRELLRQVRDTAFEAYAHQDLPFEKLVDELSPERDLSRNPLFQVAFVLQNAPEEEKDPSGLSITFQDVDQRSAHFDLDLHLYEHGSRLRGRLVYDTDLFDRTTARRLARHFGRLLEATASRPDARFAQLDYLSRPERHQLLREWNAVQADPVDLCFHRIFEQQAERAPDAVAVEAEGVLTYAELNRRANRVAHHLRDLGSGPERRVALMAERCTAALAAILGVLKSGAAYLPIDPDTKPDRLAYLLQDSAALLLDPLFPPGPLPSHNPELEVDAANPAYVIYTSGSTGRPKGVVIEHRQLAAYVRSVRRTLDLSGQPRGAPLTGFATDLAHTMTFPILAGGGCVHLAKTARLASAETAARHFSRHTADVFKTVPSHLAALLESRRARHLLPRRLAVLGGEALSWSLVERLRELAPRCAVVNHYGPTETTVGVATMPGALTRPRRGTASVPIGRPLAGARLVLTDPALQAVALGVPGEISIGGRQLARGYLGRPALTAGRFVANPFDASPGARLYRTGDLARQLFDGAVEFLGRLDRQVKVRGFRLELGEVEAVLREHSAVRDAAVLAAGSEPGAPPGTTQGLTAFFVAESAAAGSGGELTHRLDDFVRSRLPGIMVPTAWQRLEELPLSPTGKLDTDSLRQRLSSAAALAGSGTDGTLGPPRTPTEEILAEIWSDVLGTPRVSPNESFFNLGGHSLLGTRMISRIERSFHLELPLRTLFERPTVAGMAEEIDAALELGAGLALPPVEPASRDRPLPLSFAQQRLWFIDQLTGAAAAYNMPAVFRLTGRLDVGALERCFRAIGERHEALRTTFDSVAGRAHQVISETLEARWSEIDLRRLPASRRREEARRRMEREARRPFDLSRGPLLRIHLLRQGGERHYLLVNLHHIVSDGWSHGVFYRELATFYRSFSGRAAAPDPAAELPDLPVQYADFAVWQRRWLAADGVEERLRPYFEKLGALCRAATQLTPDRARPAVPSYRGDAVGFEVPAGTAAGLKHLSLQEKVSLYMTLAAGFMTLLHRVTGEPTIVVGSPIANRNRREIEGLIGFFVNMLLMGCDLSDDPAATELLERVREIALEAYAHQSFPFERLVEKLAPERELSRHPLFQIAFALQNAPRFEAALPGLEVHRLAPPTATARFDLELFMWEEDERLEGSFVYSTDLFDAATTVRLVRHFENLLRDLASRPEARTVELSLWAAGERHQLLVEWNDRVRPLPRGECVHHLFEDRARRSPDVTLVFEGGRLSFQELDRRANQLARHLRRLGAGPEGQVGLFLQRRFEMVVALLGIFKAGGVFVPLDPDHPRDRLDFLVRDSGMRILLTEASLVERLPAGVAPTLVVLDRQWDAIARHRSDSPAVPCDLRNAAFMIYTSGSTGQPKGAVNSHRGLVNHLLWMRATYPLDGSSRVVHKSSASFDISLWEIFWPLLEGACLVLARPGGQRDTSYLADLVASEEITVLYFVPSMLPVFLDEPALTRLSSLERVVCGGEALPASLARRFARCLPRTRLYNFYGPAEAAIGITIWNWDPADRRPRIPVGRGVDNTRIYLLDAALRLVPAGQAGELCCGGAQVARGYHRRPRLTAEKFVPDPMSQEGAERLYRTGDLARYRPDGAVEYLGRHDHQIKIRGVRMEPGEIETVLAEHVAVREAVVVPEEHQSHRLVAYAVLTERCRRELGESQVAHWQEVYETVYVPDRAPAGGGHTGRPTTFFDVSGWNSSYTGEPLPAEDMQEWLDLVVERILSRRPPPEVSTGARRPWRVLEIGCGTGLVLGRVAAHATDYVGTDFSPPVMKELRARIAASGLDHVRLRTGRADDFTGIEAAGFDTVILNSVVQYFPGVDYLLRVLQGAVEAAAPGATVFVGDVRSLPLLDAFCASVELYRATDRTPVPELRKRIRRRRLQEEELVLDPAFFHALARRLPRIRQVRILPRDSRRRNEMSLFRYDVFLHLDTADGAGLPPAARPNRFLAREHRLLELLRDTPERLRTAGDLARELEAHGETTRQHGEIRHYDTTLHWTAYANDPLRAKAGRQLEPRLREHLHRRLPEPMVPATLVLLDSLPHLASGKIDRVALRRSGADLAPDRRRPHLREAFLAPRTASERRLERIWSELLELDRVGVRDNFFQLGGDSILGIRIVARAREAGVDVALKDLFQHQTIGELARQADLRARSAAKLPSGSTEEDGPATGAVPLTPIQHWFFDQELAEAWHYNQSVLLATKPLDAALLASALRHVLRHHDMLRARFTRRGGEWRQHVRKPHSRTPLSFIDLCAAGAERRRESIERAAARLQASLDLTRGPLVRAAFFAPDRLLVVIHHLIVDRVSWPVLIEDLERAYRQLASGLTVTPRAKTTSYQEWAGLLARYAQSAELREELAVWRRILPEDDPGLPVDLSGPNVRASTETVPAVLGEVDTRLLLQEVPAVYDTRVIDPLLLALARSFIPWTGRKSLLVELEGHGREEIFDTLDLSRTVGWFTTTYPVFLDLEGVSGHGEALSAVSRQLRAVPRHGLGFGLLRTMSGDPAVAAQLASVPRPGVRFNYVGRIEPASEALFDFAAEGEGPNSSPRQQRAHLLELNGYVFEGKLRIDWNYSRGLHRPPTVEKLARTFLAELRRIIAHCLRL